MFSKRIDGVQLLNSKLPDELQYWHKFGNIIELTYKSIPDDYPNYTKCIDMILTDIQNKYFLKVSLFNVSGNFNFDVSNGFYSGLRIIDCSDMGYEKSSTFCVSSIEQEINFSLYCEKIKVELL